MEKVIAIRISKKLTNLLKRSAEVILIFAILIPYTIHTIPLEPNELWEYSMETEFDRNFDLFATFNATAGYQLRQNIYVNGCKNSTAFHAQAARIFLGENVSESVILNSLDRIYEYKDCMDFTIVSLVRMLYLDINMSILNSSVKDQVIDALGRGKYWYTEPSDDSAIFYTENHQILYHSSEYLLGQLFPNDTFTNSGMNGTEHRDFARPMIIRWLDWRAQFGFTEWHSNVYYVEDIAPLVNLVDFAEDEEIATKAAMVLDLIAFDFAMNYYKNRYATSTGRTYDTKKVGESLASPADRDSTNEAAWLMLGIAEHQAGDTGNMAAVALATSEYYAPPPILEAIASNASLYNEHKERNNIDITDGPLYNISHSEDEMMFWWTMFAHLTPENIETTYNILEKYNIDPWTVCGPQILLDFLEVMAFLHGQSLSDYAHALRLLTQGVSLETANCYTYRTPYYQLSGVQDHQKGMDGMQEHIWQATLDDQAFVYTSSPGGLTKDFEQFYVGGWKPRATFHKNMGVIQYDRLSMPLEGEAVIFLLNLITGRRFYNHAYFPRWAFDNVTQSGKWTFGVKDDGYVALYSYEPVTWKSDYELRASGYKNLWIVELGSIDEYGSFENFTNSILQAPLVVSQQAVGYQVAYTSPSQGEVSVAWEGAFTVNGTDIDLGPYPRFDNNYCYHEFGTTNYTIQHGLESLVLDFNTSTRIYQSL
jgi:hypothetical protein